jgi:hypothetical protein
MSMLKKTSFSCHRTVDEKPNNENDVYLFLKIKQ